MARVAISNKKHWARNVARNEVKKMEKKWKITACSFGWCLMAGADLF
jgi:hypothetical protein